MVNLEKYPKSQPKDLLFVKMIGAHMRLLFVLRYYCDVSLHSFRRLMCKKN